MSSLHHLTDPILISCVNIFLTFLLLFNHVTKRLFSTRISILQQFQYFHIEQHAHFIWILHACIPLYLTVSDVTYILWLGDLRMKSNILSKTFIYDENINGKFEEEKIYLFEALMVA